MYTYNIYTQKCMQYIKNTHDTYNRTYANTHIEDIQGDLD